MKYYIYDKAGNAVYGYNSRKQTFWVFMDWIDSNPMTHPAEFVGFDTRQEAREVFDLDKKPKNEFSIITEEKYKRLLIKQVLTK